MSRSSNSLNVNFTITFSVTLRVIQDDAHKPTQLDMTRPDPTRPYAWMNLTHVQLCIRYSSKKYLRKKNIPQTVKTPARSEKVRPTTTSSVAMAISNHPTAVYPPWDGKNVYQFSG